MVVMMFLLFLTVLLVSLGYLFFRIRAIFLKGEPAKTASKENRKKATLLTLIPIVILAVVSAIRPYIFIVPIFHLAVFWAIFDVIFLVVQKLRKGKKLPFWLAGALALPLAVIYMTVAYFLATHYATANTGSAGRREGWSHRTEDRRPGILLRCRGYRRVSAG